MRVKDCQDSNCSHCVRRVWSQGYTYCDLHDKRIPEVEDCHEYARLNGQISIFDEENENEA